MSYTKLRPTEQEVEKWILSTLQHVCQVEYFLGHFNLGGSDPQRPHDLIGVGNKFEWDIIKSLSLQYRTPKVDFDQNLLPALMRHRLQYHHQKWNNPDPFNDNLPVEGTTNEDMLVGAIDAVCSLRENRSYQGGSHTYEDIITIARDDPPHKKPWLLQIIPKMRQLPQPDISLITSFEDIPNIGLDHAIYTAIVERTNEAVERVRTHHGYELNGNLNSELKKPQSTPTYFP